LMESFSVTAHPLSTNDTIIMREEFVSYRSNLYANWNEVAISRNQESDRSVPLPDDGQRARTSFHFLGELGQRHLFQLCQVVGVVLQLYNGGLSVSSRNAMPWYSSM
jgi:hypothetical protein